MYRILVDGVEVQGGGKLVIDPVLEEAVGCAGTLTYTIPYNDESYGMYQERVNVASVYEEDRLLWSGRLLTTKVFLNGNKELLFEGEMSYLNDIVFPPYEFQGDIPDFIDRVLNHYNSLCSTSRQIKRGNVTVVDANGYIARSSSDYDTCWNVLSDKLPELLGGFFRLRYWEGERYLDYLADSGMKNTQRIEFGVNLLDIENYIDATELSTVLIPLGAQVDDERVTIAEVNNGSIYIETPFVEQYGRIESIAVWDDVTLASNLLTKGNAWASQMVAAALSITARVVDLHITGPQYESFMVGDLIDCYSPPQDLNVTLMLAKRALHLNDVSQDTVTIGNDRKTFSESLSLNIKELNEENKAQKVYNANLSERIDSAKGLYTTVETDEDGKRIIWAHNRPLLGDSELRINISDVGIHLSGDYGASWYGVDFNGEFLARLIDAYRIKADRIYGGTLSSIAVDSSGQPITYINMDDGDTAKFGNIAFIRRTSGNESLKWMGGDQ